MIEYTVKVYDDGAKIWHLNNQIHREDGPAIEYPNGTNKWFINNKLHREDGPAIEYSSGDKVWWIDDKRHREDGPAIEYGNGNKEWWINGFECTEEEFNFLINPKDCSGSTVIVDGVEYTLNRKS
jgi:hypothetical protein